MAKTEKPKEEEVVIPKLVCPNCDGSGKSVEDECSNCGGKGTV